MKTKQIIEREIIFIIIPQTCEDLLSFDLGRATFGFFDLVSLKQESCDLYVFGFFVKYNYRIDIRVQKIIHIIV